MSYEFNYQQEEKKQEYAPLPDGEYDGTVEKSEVKQTKTGSTIIKLQLRLDNKRVLFDMISLQAQNPKAREIAMQKVKNIVVNGLAKTAEKKATFGSLDEIASYLKGMPVKIKYKYEGKSPEGYDREKIFYNAVEDTKRLHTANQAAIGRGGPSY